MFLLVILFVFIIIVIGIKHIKLNSDYWRKRGVLQVDGIFSKFFSSKRSMAEIYKDAYDEYEDKKCIGVILGNKPALILKDVRDIQAVMQSDFLNFYGRGIVTNPNDTLADNVLFINDYRRWKILRHKLSPVFTSMKLKIMFYIMERCARDFVKFVESNESAQLNTFNALYTYTTACIGATIFGIDTQTKDTMDSPFLEMARKAIEPSFIGNLKFTIASMFPKLNNFLNIKQFGEHEDFFVGIVKQVFNSRRNNKEIRHDFVDTCLELQDQGILKDLTTGYEVEPTVELLAAQAFFFFLAGVDTSATTMHFTLLELASNQNVLKRLHNEIDNMFEKSNEKITFEDINTLSYLDMVINETIRKYPPIGVIQRQCTQNTVLPSENVSVEKDSVIILPIFALHRDPKYFPNPQLFDPERFAPDNVSKILKFSYLPFGEGNRMCLGARFARVQVKSGLAWLLRKFTLKEQTYDPKTFEPSVFSIRDSKANFELIPRT